MRHLLERLAGDDVTVTMSLGTDRPILAESRAGRAGRCWPSCPSVTWWSASPGNRSSAGSTLLRGKHISALGNDPEHIQHWGRGEFQRLVGEQLQVRDAPLVFPWTLLSAEVRG
jgi:hypothetical protein